MNSTLTQSNGTALQERVPVVVTGVDPDQRTRMLEHKSFSFHHSLSDYPGLSLPGIKKLTRQLLEEKRFDQVYCLGGGGKGGVSDPVSTDKVLATLESLDTAGAWLRLTRVDEINEELKEICETFYADLSKLFSEDIKSQVMKTFVTLFISSPKAVTPYHMDHSWNFLLQIGGHKTVYLYDQNDTRVVRPQDQEGFYMKRDTLKQNEEIAGTPFELSPGIGAHHPVNAPHWVQNGSEVSVSLSFGLCLHASNDDAKVHQANFLLRKLGLNPLPPRRSRWRDSVKLGAMNMLSDRNPKSFDDVVYSGQRRLERILKKVRVVR